MTKSIDAHALHAKAHAAGMAAGNAASPTPMVVVGAGGYRDVVNDGPCGFGWVWLKGNTAVGRAMRAAGIARPDYPTGLSIWCSEFGQSYERKRAYAAAYAGVLREAGASEAVGRSRLD